MAIALTGNGGLFVRLGHLFGGIADVIALQGAAATARVLSGASMATRGTTIEADAAYSPAVSDQIDNHWTSISTWRGAQNSLFGSFKSLGEKILIRQVDLDASLPSKDVTTALTELIRQMRASGDDIADSTASAGSQTTVSATGTAKIVVSMKNRDGWLLQTPYAETLRFTVTADSQSGGATARSESVSVRGAASVGDVSAYNWPAGSGCSTGLSIVDAQADNSKGNLLYNGDFETDTTTNYVDDWVIGTGAAGTDFIASSDSYTGTQALELVGDGSTLLAIRQLFDTAHSTTAGGGGTPAELEPNQQYAIGMWVKRGSSSIAAGVLRVALVDGANSVTTDVAGTSNSFTIDCTALTTGYVFYSGTFRTPLAIPATGFRLELKTTTAITNTKEVYVDDVAFAKMTPLYAGGPSAAIFAGDTDVIKNDQWTVAISCTMGAVAMWMERFFSLNSKGLLIPYDSGGSEVVADSVVA